MRVHIGERLLAVDAPTVVTGLTCRPAAVVAWSANGRAFTLTDRHRRPVWHGQAALIPPSFSRGLQAVDCDLISLSFEPGHPLHGPLSAMGNRGVQTLSAGAVGIYSCDIQHLIPKLSTELSDIASDLAARLIADGGRRRAQETWVEDALAECDDKLGEVGALRVPGLARALGIPVRSYRLWRRFRRALAALQTGADLTVVAHEVGFYDLAQMSRTFMTYYGVQPSRLRKPEVLQIVVPFDTSQQEQGSPRLT